MPSKREEQIHEMELKKSPTLIRIKTRKRMSRSSKLKNDLYFIVHKFLNDNDAVEASRMFAREKAFYLDLNHLEEVVLKGMWDEAEAILSQFIPLRKENILSVSLYFVIMKQKFLETLKGGDVTTARKILFVDMALAHYVSRGEVNELERFLSNGMEFESKSRSLVERRNKVFRKLETQIRNYLSKEATTFVVDYPVFPERRLNTLINQALDHQKFLAESEIDADLTPCTLLTDIIDSCSGVEHSDVRGKSSELNDDMHPRKLRKIKMEESASIEFPQSFDDNEPNTSSKSKDEMIVDTSDLKEVATNDEVSEVPVVKDVPVESMDEKEKSEEIEDNDSSEMKEVVEEEVFPNSKESGDHYEYISRAKMIPIDVLNESSSEEQLEKMENKGSNGVAQFKFHSELVVREIVTDCCFLRNSVSVLAVGTKEGDVYFIDLKTGNCENMGSAGRSGIKCLCGTQNREVAVGLESGRCCLLQGDENKWITGDDQMRHDSAVTSMCIVQVKRLLCLISGALDGSLFLWDTDGMLLLDKVHLSFPVVGLCIGFNNQTAITVLQGEKPVMISADDCTLKWDQLSLEPSLSVTVSDDQIISYTEGGRLVRYSRFGHEELQYSMKEDFPQGGAVAYSLSMVFVPSPSGKVYVYQKDNRISDSVIFGNVESSSCSIRISGDYAVVMYDDWKSLSVFSSSSETVHGNSIDVWSLSRNIKEGVVEKRDEKVEILSKKSDSGKPIPLKIYGGKEGTRYPVIVESSSEESDDEDVMRLAKEKLSSKDADVDSKAKEELRKVETRLNTTHVLSKKSRISNISDPEQLMEISSSGKHLYHIDKSNVLSVVNLWRRKVWRHFPLSVSGVPLFAITTSGSYFLLSVASGLQWFNVKKSKVVNSTDLKGIEYRSIVSMKFAKDNNYIYLGTKDRRIFYCQLSGTELSREGFTECKGEAVRMAVDYSDFNFPLAFVTEFGGLYTYWDGKPARCLNDGVQSVVSLQYNNKGKLLVGCEHLLILLRGREEVARLEFDLRILNATCLNTENELISCLLSSQQVALMNSQLQTISVYDVGNNLVLVNPKNEEEYYAKDENGDINLFCVEN